VLSLAFRLLQGGKDIKHRIFNPQMSNDLCQKSDSDDDFVTIDSPGKWESLMGKDIMMKIFDKGDIFSERPVDADYLGAEMPQQQDAEINDYTLIDYDGFYCTADIEEDQDFINHEKDFITHEMSQKNPDASKFVRFIQGTDVLAKLGNGEISQGLELSLRFLPIGKCAIIRCHSKFAHPEGRLNNCTGTDESSHPLQPNTSVVYRLYLQSIKPFGDRQSYSFRMKLAKQLKAIGNDSYKHEWVESNAGGMGKLRSLKAYNNASEELISVMKDLSDETAEEIPSSQSKEHLKADALSLVVDCYNNIAAVHLRYKDYAKAKEAATEAITLDPDNVKALCRAAKAAMMSGSMEECLAALNAVLDIEKENKDGLKLLKEFFRRKVINKKKEKAMYARMMESPSAGKEVLFVATKESSTTKEETTIAEEVLSTTKEHSSIPKEETPTVQEGEANRHEIHKEQENLIVGYLVVGAMLLALWWVIDAL